MSSKIILGVDPGTSVMGFGVIKVTNKKLELLLMGNLKLSKIQNHDERFKKILHRTLSLIKEFEVDEMAIEAPFFGKNVQSMLKLGRAQGVAISAALLKDIPYTEYAPKKIKQAITGKGTATKEDVAEMLKSLLKIKKMPDDLDASDGVAAAVCHHYNSNNGIEKNPTNYNSWANFVSKNQDRTK